MIIDKFVPLVVIPEDQNYEAYLYLVVFEHNKRKKYYLGYHVGLFDGTYKGSPETHEKEFKRDLGKYPYKIYCLDIGTHEDMIYKEKEMLDQIKSEGKFGEMYNESTGGGKELKNYNPTVEIIQDAIENDELETEHIPKEEVNEFKWYQVRFQDLIKKHVSRLRKLIEESDGAWLEEYHRGVLVLKDYYGKGEHCRIGSAHTTEAVQPIDQVTHLKVIWIPTQLSKKLSPSDIKEIGQWDNPQDQAPRLPTEEDETSTWIAESCIEKEIEPSHISFRRKLQRQGYSNYEITPRIKKAEKILEDMKAFQGSGYKQIDWESAPYCNELQTKIDSFKGISFVAAAGNPEKILVRLMSFLLNNPKETRFKIFVNVTYGLGAKRQKDDWDQTWKPWVMGYIKMLVKEFRLKNGKPQLQIDIEDLEFSTLDPNSIN